MKNLLEVSRIVTKKKVRKIEILDESTLENANSKFSEFYAALMAGKFKNDRDAASLLYSCSPTDDKYRQLKSRFRKRLLNTLFFLDLSQPSAGSYDRAYFSCNKDWTLVKILIANEAHLTAEDLAKQILHTALKFKFADVIVNCARILRKYAAEAENEKDFEECDKHIKHYSDILDAEIRSEELYQRVLMKYRVPREEIPGLEEKIDVFCNALVGLSETYDSPVINYNMLMVWALRYEILQDFEAMLQVCDRAEKYIEQHPQYYQDDKLAAFRLKKMTAYLHLQDFKNGKINAEKSLQTFEESSDTWFKFLEFYLLLAMHTGNYINGYAILNRAKQDANFRKLDLETREKWKIYEVYLSYFIETETEEESAIKEQMRKNFRISRFLNDQIIYPREQRIFTVHLVIAQVLFLLDKKNYVQATERIERLKSYTNKQLKKEEHFRMIQFNRLLQQLAKGEFSVANLAGEERFYEKLVDTPFFYRGLIQELEIVPFEKLWNHVLSKVK